MSRQLPRLAHHALTYLEKRAQETAHKQLPRTFELRLALAYLHIVSGKDRVPFDAFWLAATKTQFGQTSAYHEGNLRLQKVRGALEAIRDALEMGDHEALGRRVRRAQTNRAYWSAEDIEEDERIRQARTCSLDLDR